MLRVTLAIWFYCSLLLQPSSVDAFTIVPTSSWNKGRLRHWQQQQQQHYRASHRGFGKVNNGGSSSSPPPPPRGHHRPTTNFDGQDPEHLFLQRRNDTETMAVRGGGAASAATPAASSSSSSDTLVKGTQATLASTASYWSRALQSVQSTIAKPFHLLRLKTSRKSPLQKQQAELLKHLQTLPVQRVTISNNATVLPHQVVQRAAQRSGLLGQPLHSSRVQQFAQALQTWYTRNGFVLSKVTGATLNADTATAEIAVREPHCAAPQPVEIQFCKEMVVDHESGAVMTMRQYKNHHEQRKTFGFGNLVGSGSDNAIIQQDKLNTTLVPATGRINPLRIAAALGLAPQRPFQWDASRWNRIMGSGIFGKVLRATPTQLEDGTIQLQILATEAPARHLEYGVGRSLYSGSWEGALEFEHANLLGGGERLGLSVRRGTKDAEPSARLSFSDSKFGHAGAYDCELFSEYIGDPADEANATTSKNVVYSPEVDSTLDRKGATFRIHDKLLRKSVASVSVEQTVTKAGRYENIGSSTISVGPFVKELPMDARTNFDTVITTGTRLVEIPAGDEAAHEKVSFLSSKTFLPYSSITATTRQLFPLTTTRTASAIGSASRPLLLALRHSITASTRNLPRHVAKAQGIASSIRGSDSRDEVSSSAQGSVELRIPVTIPLLPEKVEQDSSVILFGDWMYACKENSSPFAWKSSIGVGIRKNVKGFPLKVDLCYSPEYTNHRLKLKPQFGLGGDFVV